MLRGAIERSLLWCRDHPRVMKAVGAAGVIGAGYFGGPPAAKLAEKALPAVCETLRACPRADDLSQP